ncbi:MAG: winged helix-turn-helix domain-containing protein [Candidatus Brocadiia bacterium]
MAKKSKCEKYGMAITDYILGEQMDMPESELFSHVANCDNCRKDLVNWRNTYAAMKNKAYLEKPEVQQKYRHMLESIKQGKACPEANLPKDEKLIDIQWEIGHPAGTIWNHLAKHGKMTMEELVGKSSLKPIIFERAIGWLAKENKICMTQAKDAVYVYLTPTEQIIARRRQTEANR